MSEVDETDRVVEAVDKLRSAIEANTAVLTRLLDAAGAKPRGRPKGSGRKPSSAGRPILETVAWVSDWVTSGDLEAPLDEAGKERLAFVQECLRELGVASVRDLSPEQAAALVERIKARSDGEVPDDEL